MMLNASHLRLLAALLSASAVVVGCSARPAADIDAGDVGATDPSSSDLDPGSPTPTTPPVSTTPPAPDGGAPDASSDDAGLDASFPDADGDAGVAFCTKGYVDETRGGKMGGGPVVVSFSKDAKPTVPDPQCLRVTTGRVLRFEGDLQVNPVFVVSADGTVQVPLDADRTDRASYTFAKAGSYFFATKNEPTIERGHVVVLPPAP